MSFYDTAKKKAANDRHWKQVETGLMTAGAAAAVFFVKTAVEHLMTKQGPSEKRSDSFTDRLMRGKF